MKLEPFLLDIWLEQKHDPALDIRCDLASSVGPRWSVGSLAERVGGDLLDELREVELVYTSRQGTRAAREAVAAFEGVDPEHVLLTTGASEAIFALLFRVAGTGANVLVPRPGYPAFRAVAQALGIEVRSYELFEPNGWSHDRAEIEHLVDRKTALFFVNSPHNPTGSVIDPEDLAELSALCTSRGARLVCDQVYHPLYHGEERPTAAGAEDVTVLGDASKALCLGGLRIGWIIEPDSKRRQEYGDTRAVLTVTNAAVSQYLLVVALRHADVILDAARNVARTNLQSLDRFFEEQSAHVAWTRPQGGLTAFPRLLNHADAVPFCRELLTQGVLVAPGAYLDGSDDHFRLGIGVETQVFEEGLSRIAATLERQPTSTSTS